MISISILTIERHSNTFDLLFYESFSFPLRCYRVFLPPQCCAAASDVTVTSTWNWSIILLIMFNFLHRTNRFASEDLNMSSAATGINFDSTNGSSYWLAFYETQRTTVSGTNLLYCSTEEKVTYILNGLRVSKLTAFFCFWVNYTFNLHFKTPQCHCIRKQISSSNV